MILPNKNIHLRNSLLGIGSALLPSLGTPQSISELWERTHSFPEYSISFEKFVLTLDFLYAINLIQIREGLVCKT